MRDCSVHSPPTDWDEIVLWSVVEMRGKSLKACIGKLSLGGTVYHLWLQRDSLLHDKTLWIEKNIVSRIRWKVKSKVLTKFPPRFPL